MITTIKQGSSAETVRKKYKKHIKSKEQTAEVRRLCGSIQLKKDPIKLQKDWRNEW